MSLSEWNVITGKKGSETTEWATAGKKSYLSPKERSVIAHEKTLNDKPKSGHIDFDFRLTNDSSLAGAVFKASSSEFIYVYFKVVNE